MKQKYDIFNFSSVLSLIILAVLSGCMLQKPEYLTMLSPEELAQVMSQKDIVLVDVHIPEQQHIKGTDLFIPFNKIEENLAKLPEDKNTPIYLYCEGGPMGNAAARTLHDLGYTNLFNLAGGADAWAKKGFAFQ